MLRGQLAHTTTNQVGEVVQDIGQQNELLWVEQWSSRVIQQFGALDSNPDAADLVFAVPKLRHLLVEALELLGELLGRDHGRVRVSLGRLGVKGTLPVLALSHPDCFVNLFAFATEVISDLLAICKRLEHRENLELLALP